MIVVSGKLGMFFSRKDKTETNTKKRPVIGAPSNFRYYSNMLIIFISPLDIKHISVLGNPLLWQMMSIRLFELGVQSEKIIGIAIAVADALAAKRAIAQSNLATGIQLSRLNPRN